MCRVRSVTVMRPCRRATRVILNDSENGTSNGLLHAMHVTSTALYPIVEQSLDLVTTSSDKASNFFSVAHRASISNIMFPDGPSSMITTTSTMHGAVIITYEPYNEVLRSSWFTKICSAGINPRLASSAAPWVYGSPRRRSEIYVHGHEGHDNNYIKFWGLRRPAGVDPRSATSLAHQKTRRSRDREMEKTSVRGSDVCTMYAACTASPPIRIRFKCARPHQKNKKEINNKKGCVNQGCISRRVQ